MKKLNPEPRPPVWAVETGGLTIPEEGVSFVDYWRDAGVPAEVIDNALVGLTARTADVANVRMATYVRRTCSQTFEKWLARRLSVVR